MSEQIRGGLCVCSRQHQPTAEAQPLLLSYVVLAPAVLLLCYLEVETMWQLCNVTMWLRGSTPVCTAGV
jgi:hypothetical protein